MFKTTLASLKDYNSVKNGFIKICMDHSILTILTKTVWVYYNQKPWLNRKIQSLLKSSPKAFIKDDPTLYKKTRYNLSKAISDVMRDFKTSWGSI